jgi:mono/diheme cytochrome c family protein
MMAIDCGVQLRGLIMNLRFNNDNDHKSTGRVARVMRFLCLAMLAAALAAAALFCLPGVMKAQAQDRPQAHGKAQAADSATNAGGDVARGRYLVENVAMCGQCHTPRDANSVLDRSHWLEGAAVPWMPSQAQANWPLLAPRIGGTPPAPDADMIKLLTTGIWTDGKMLRFPMMPFRMSEADARAVVAYLKAPSAWNGPETKSPEMK